MRDAGHETNAVSHREPSPSDRWVEVVSTGLILGLFLLPIRALVLGTRLQDVLTSFSLFRWVVLGSYYDVLYIVAVTGLGVGGLWLARRRPRAQRVVSGAYAAAAVLSLIAAVVNLNALRALGGPVTYQWLYYSDFLGSFDARHAIAAHLSPKLLAAVVLACGVMPVGAKLLCRGIRYRYPDREARRVLPAVATAFLLYLVVAGWRVDRVGASQARLANPIVAFVASIGAAHRSPFLTLLTQATTPPPDQVSLSSEPRNEQVPADSLLLRRIKDANLRNVVVFVLESVPAQYLGVYGDSSGATPNIDQYARQARRFANLYAHGPSTDAALVSLLLSIHPPISYRGLTVTHPGIQLPSLSGELHRRGYRTAFFNAADNRFQNFDEFLSHRELDAVADHTSLECPQRVPGASTVQWPSLYSTDDECLVIHLARWTREAAGQPFFAMLWTMQTHYPYFFSGTERQFGATARGLNRYLNALHHSDWVFGELMRSLEKQRLLESTLIVVVGDHGEAFGQHGRRVHGELLYEEDLRTPLLLINPRLFGGEVDSVVSGMKDVAPTVLDLLGYPSPPVWQGRSLVGGERSGRSYFVSLRADFRFGYREGRHKFLFNATENTSELYDLRADPGETVNLASRSPALVRLGVERLAAWVQSHDRFMKIRLSESSGERAPLHLHR
jgi:lipoteichoic acid synthase